MKEQGLFLINKDELKNAFMEFYNEMQSKDEQTPSEPEKEAEKLLTTAETAEMLRISLPTLHRWKKNGVIPHVRLNKSIRYRESDIMKVLDKKRA